MPLSGCWRVALCFLRTFFELASRNLHWPLYVPENKNQNSWLVFMFPDVFSCWIWICWWTSFVMNSNNLNDVLETRRGSSQGTSWRQTEGNVTHFSSCLEIRAAGSSAPTSHKLRYKPYYSSPVIRFRSPYVELSTVFPVDAVDAHCVDTTMCN